MFTDSGYQGLSVTSNYFKDNQSGLQVCWGWATAGETHSFPLSFRARPAVSALHLMGSTSGGCFYYGLSCDDGVTFFVRNNTDTESEYFYYIAVGYG